MLHKILLVLVAWVTSSSVALAVTNEPARVFMPDGQFKSHLLRVFVTKDLTQADKPVLSLLSGEYLLKQRTNGFAQEAPAVEVARFQNWTEKSPNGIHIPHTGTLLLFDLRATPFPFIKACIRFTPVLKWGAPEQTAIGESPIYLGNQTGAILWTLGILSLLATTVHQFTRRSNPSPAFGFWPTIGRLLQSPDGRVSLSKTQAAAWTLCIGAIVFYFGLTRLQTPTIPESLVALMGLSLATRAISLAKERQSPEITGRSIHTEGATVTTPDTPLAESTRIRIDPPPVVAKPQLSDLIHTGDKDGNPIPSIIKAQMFFWTCLVIILFCVKSILDGILWDVPWQLVTVMGMSQTTYMLPKFLDKPK
jgi:hypothetical protein